MKYLLIIALTLNLFKCSPSYDSILEGLAKSHVLLSEEMEEDLYLEYFKITKQQYIKDLKTYNISLKNFYDADKYIIEYLFRYENDTLHFNKWIKAKNPYSSNIQKNDLITNSQRALILIDNYLTNNSSICAHTYMKNMSYQRIKSFYNNNKGLNKEELRNEYLKFVKKIK